VKLLFAGVGAGRSALFGVLMSRSPKQTGVQRQRAGSAHKSANEESTENVAFPRGGHIVL